MFAKIDRWDKKITHEWNQVMLKSPWLPFVQKFSFILGPDIWATIMVISGFITAFFFNKQAGFYLIGRILQSYLIFVPLKHLTKRYRPFAQNKLVYCLDEKVSKYCFPSGHAIFFLLFWISLGLLLSNGWVLIIGTVLGILVGLSRICLGVHFPSDVIIGFLYAWSAALLFEYLTQWIWFQILDFVLFFI